MTRHLGLFGIAAAVLFASADIAGSVLTPGYSRRADPISELVERGASFKHVIDPLLLAYHASVIPFAAGLHFAIGGPRHALTGPLLLGSADGAVVLLTLFFPCDQGCEPFVTLPGMLHIFVAIPMGLLILAAIWAFSRRMARVSAWSRYRGYSRFTAVLGLVLAGVTIALAESGVVGILERALTISYLQWYVVVGARALRSP